MPWNHCTACCHIFLSSNQVCQHWLVVDSGPGSAAVGVTCLRRCGRRWAASCYLLIVLLRSRVCHDNAPD